MKQVSTFLSITHLVAGLAVILSLLVSPPLLAEIYKWTDENGVTHYTQTPPPSGQEAEIEDLPEASPGQGLGEPGDASDSEPGTQSEQPSAADLQRQRLATQARLTAEEYAANQAMCEEARQELAEIEPSRRVYYTNEDGETVRMDDEERVNEVKRLRNVLSANCQ